MSGKLQYLLASLVIGECKHIHSKPQAIRAAAAALYHGREGFERMKFIVEPQRDGAAVTRVPMDAQRH